MRNVSQPTRLPKDVYDAAAAVAPIASRSVAQQIAHWARIGREAEMAPQINQRAIAQVLSGAAEYDQLDAEHQALVRADWALRASEIRAELNYAREFSAKNEQYSELDEDGNVVVRNSRQ